VRRAVPFAVVLALLLVAAGACGDEPADVPDDPAEAELQGLLRDQEPEVEELPDERTEPTTALVEADEEPAQGYEHEFEALSALGDDPALGELAASCFNTDISSCDVLYEESPGGSLYEAYGATCGARLDEPTTRLCVDVLLPPAEEWEGGSDAFLDELAGQCEAGDLLDCDLLFVSAERSSQYEAYGATCGHRLEGDADSIDEECAEAFDL
jgi:hypothetical protein